MPTRGRIYLDREGRPTLDRVVNANEEVRVTFYPTSSYDDEPITVCLRRISNGPNRGQVAVSLIMSEQGFRKVLLEQLVDQPATAKER